MGYQTGKSKQKFITHYGISYCYKRYIEDYCKKGNTKKKTLVKNKYYMSQAKYSQVIKECNLAVMNLIIKRNLDFKIPFRMGYINVAKKKVSYIKLPNGRVRCISPVDWQATHDMWNSNPKAKEQKKVVYFTNEHSGGFIFKIRYLNNTANFTGKTYYRFHPTREFNKMLSDEIFNNKDFDAILAKKYAETVSYYDLTKYNKT